MKRRYIAILSIILVVCIFTAANLLLQERLLTTQHPLELQRPGFVDVAHAEENSPLNIGNKLDEEAGIAAYTNTASPINLNQVRDLFSTIELETGNYIIGSIPVPDYPEKYHAHAYVHKDGWILAYYLQDDPAAKIVNVRSRSLDGSNLKDVVGIVAGTGGVPFSGVEYYDFRYPNATNLLIVGEETGGTGNNFEITMPTEYGYFERSWSLRDFGNVNSKDGFYIDGVAQTATYWDGAQGYGSITVSDLLPGSAHTISVHHDDYGALVVTYRVP